MNISTITHLDRIPPQSATLPSATEFARLSHQVDARLRYWARLALLRWRVSMLMRPALQRTLDLAGATAGLVILSPLMLITAAAIRLETPGPALFTQTRIGKRGRTFNMFKFRSMRVTAETEKAVLMEKNDVAGGVLFKMKVDPRVTRVGRLIRRLSIDELPQLINILQGNMAIVGPRPAIPLEVQRYDTEARKRLHVKPGLTCLWQISGRSNLSFAEQVGLDIRYLAKRSLRTDLGIIIKTVPAVLTGKGAY